MAQKMDCASRIFITLSDISREILVFQCERLGMSKSQFINMLIQNTVDREYLLEGRKK